ncbi:hypothetical protein D3C78_1573090 [compost metagenome]
MRDGIARQLALHFARRKHHRIDRKTPCNRQPGHVARPLGLVARNEQTAVVAPAQVGLEFAFQLAPDADAGLHQRHFGFVARLLAHEAPGP